MKKFGLLFLTGLLSLNLLQASDGKRPLKNPDKSVQQEHRVQRDVCEIYKELTEQINNYNTPQIWNLIIELKNLGANVNPTNKNGNTLLHWAADRGWIGIVEELVNTLQQSGESINSVDKSGTTPLHCAVRSGSLRTPIERDRIYTEVVQILVNALKLNGERINTVDTLGWTVLREAVRNDYIEVVQILVNAMRETGQDIWSRDNNGKTVFHHAVEYSNVDTVQFLVNVMRETGEDINSADNNGKTPLHLAVRAMNSNVVKFLVEKVGVDTSILDKDGKTAIEIAREIAKEFPNDRGFVGNRPWYFYINRIITTLENPPLDTI